MSKGTRLTESIKDRAYPSWDRSLPYAGAVLLLTSDFEPYQKYLTKLIGTLQAQNLQYDVLSVERFCLASTSTVPAVVIPCSNHPLVPELISALRTLRIPILNRGLATASRSRMCSMSTLQFAGFSIPERWLAFNPSVFITSIPERFYPIILKDNSHKSSRPVICSSQEHLRYEILNRRNDTTFPSPCYAERVVNNSEESVKVYFCNGLAASYIKRPGQYPVRCSDPFNASDLKRMQRSLGLDFFSLDTVTENDSPVIVDVNPFPIYKYHSEAYEWLANLVCARCR